MTTPRVSLVAFNDRQSRFIFVAVPNNRGRYLRTDMSVALVDCPQCHAIVGEPCRGHPSTPDGYGGTTHFVRRTLARRTFGHVLNAEDILCRVDDRQTTPDEYMEPAA